MTVSVVAGTFSVIHDGHRALLDRAFEIGDTVLVGITSDDMASRSHRVTLPLSMRMANLDRFLSSYGKPYEISVIDDVYGIDLMRRSDVLVVSEETESSGHRVADKVLSLIGRRVELSVVPLVPCTYASKISASDILDGRCSRSGRTDVPDIAVGSLNRVKVEAAREVMERIYGEVRVTAVDAPSGVPDQPHGSATREGAVNRARAALDGHDIGIGIEAGVFELEDGLFDFQYCAVIDKSGRLTVGTGPGFQYPPQVAALVRAGSTVGDAMKKVFGETDIGRRQGAVGFLSNGILDRKTLTEQAVTAAMIPRLHKSYEVNQ